MVNFFGTGFLSPIFFWFLLLIPVVIVLYLLKLRRTEIVIPSTFLWFKSLRDLTANAPFQRLRKNLLLLLQIIILLLVVVALARPFLRARGGEGADYCLLIDRSASMQTVEVGGQTRLDLAKERALDMIDNLERGDRVMVVSFAESAEVLAELTDNRYRLRNAVRSIEAADTRSRLRDALLVANSLTPDNQELQSGVTTNLRLVLLSDGNLADVAEVGQRAGNVTYVKVGETTANAGIVEFSVRNRGDSSGEQETFVLVHNASTQPLDTTVTLSFNDSPLTVEAVQAPPGESREVILAHADLGTGILRAELDREDALAVDNTAWLALRPDTQIKTLLVSASDSTSGYYLRRALALEPRVALSAIEPAAFAPSAEYDLVIFDAFAPETLPPAGALLFFGVVPELPGLSAVGELENPPVLATNHEHPVTRFINPSNVGIQKALQLTLPEGARPLVSTSGSTLIADVSRGGQQILVVAFSVAASDWPLKLSFPLFLQNVVSWVPGGAAGANASLPTGKPLPILPHPDATEAMVTTPANARATVALNPLRPTYFGATERAGVYEVDKDGETETYALNLLDRGETDVAPAAEIKLGRQTVAAATEPVLETREFWRWFVAGAIAVLALEWWIYSRRAWL